MIIPYTLTSEFISVTGRQCLVPTRDGDAGLDLYAVALSESAPPGQVWIRTGVAVAIPQGYVGLLCSRSSIARTGLSLCNGIGVIDSSYRGEIEARFYVLDNSLDKAALVGQRLVQLLLMPALTPIGVRTDILPETWRGSQGFGSTGSN